MSMVVVTSQEPAWVYAFPLLTQRRVGMREPGWAGALGPGTGSGVASVTTAVGQWSWRLGLTQRASERHTKVPVLSLTSSPKGCSPSSWHWASVSLKMRFCGSLQKALGVTAEMAGRAGSHQVTACDPWRPQSHPSNPPAGRHIA